MKKKNGRRKGGRGRREGSKPEDGGVGGTDGAWRDDLLALMLRMVQVPLGADY